jgi:toxin FitB
LTVGEIMKGVAMKERADRRAASRLAEWLQALRLEHADRILPVTSAIAMEWGRIAAIVHGLILVTRNAAEFSDLQVSMINP